MHPDIFDTTGRLVFVPVRHHSPACARAVGALARELRPAAVLIEGPFDFNTRLDELYLPHTLPIAIYSYVRLDDDTRRGAFYPFCEHSPEWEVLRAAREIGAAARFIDLPWAALAASKTVSHRYADRELRESPYIPTLCRKLGVEDFDSLWDRLVEIDAALTPAQLFERVHHFCYHVRAGSSRVSEEDLLREAFMAEQIRHAQAACDGPILVVTGGFHSYALFARLRGLAPPETTDDRRPTTDDREPRTDERRPTTDDRRPTTENQESSTDDGQPDTESQPPWVEYQELTVEESSVDTSEKRSSILHPPSSDGVGGRWSVVGGQERGIALTPFADARLDSLTGYEAGMPSPGFYHRVWCDRALGRSDTYRSLLATAVIELRERGQIASTADLIAVETSARTLAALRGHTAVWRQDLIDAITGALIKEAIEPDTRHPFLDALLAVFRGDKRGALADGVALPPLVHDIREQLQKHSLEPATAPRNVRLDLAVPADLARSRVLHRLRVLGIHGFERRGGTDFIARTDLTTVWEEWQIGWLPDFDAACIEAAIYGAALADATAARLMEQAAAIERSAERAALLLLDACLAGVSAQIDALLDRLMALVRQDADFFSVTAALGHLLYLYRYDDTLGALGRGDIAGLLAETFGRALWLLEMLGQPQGQDRELLRGFSALVHTFEACRHALGLDRADLADVLRRTAVATAQRALVRGAATGALWTLGAAAVEQVRSGLAGCAAPEQIGDFLTGLFALARETAQRHPELVAAIDALMMQFDDTAYLQALPALRLAFSFFTPREKHYLARTLLGDQEQAEGALPELVVDVAVAARALTIESRVLETLVRFGIRGGTQ